MPDQVRKTEVHYDVVVVGSGPAGLGAANSLAFEGSSVLVIDSGTHGGQAATSHLIENVPAFPKGVSGPELTTLLIQQGRRDGVRYKMPFRANRLDYDKSSCIFSVVGDDHESVTCRAVIIATGVQNRLLPALNATIFYGRGVSYGSPEQKPRLWEGKRVAVVGGGNAAAQAAMFLSGCTDTFVHLLVRSEALADSMSARVIGHLEKLANVDISLKTEVVELIGDDDLNLSGAKVKTQVGTKELSFSSMFVHIGSKPHTTWLDNCVHLDEKGYVYTDGDLEKIGLWTLKDRKPLYLETSHPGIFCCGDARHGHTTHRVATALADGVNAGASALKYLKLACTPTAIAA